MGNVLSSTPSPVLEGRLSSGGRCTLWSPAFACVLCAQKDVLFKRTNKSFSCNASHEVTREVLRR